MVTPKTRILLVDDSAVLRRLATVTLTSIGLYDVDEARDAFEALELMLSNDYAAILTDYYMPGIDGIEFVRRLRRMDEWGSTPVIMISTERDPYVEREAKSAGVDDFIVKPFEPGHMREVLDRLLDSRGDEQSGQFVIDAQSILDSMPYPSMVLDRHHAVILGNAAFWKQTGAGIHDHGVLCSTAMHAGGHAPDNCPLDQAVKTGEVSESRVVEGDNTLLVTVFPMTLSTGERDEFYLHIARPLD